MPELPEKPLNREPDIGTLIQSFLTEDGYDRNHSMLPKIDASKHRVRVEGCVNKPLELTVSELRNDFQQHSVVCALQCAGNRRHTMRTEIKEVQGIDWFDGAVMNCKWSGPLLKDILERADISLLPQQQEVAHVAFACNAEPCQEDEWYGASVPLARALNPEMDIILALDRNDSVLEVRHGYPVRAITPGIAGARAVKWLDTITVQVLESQNHYQQNDYKVLPEQAVDTETAKPFWSRVEPINEMPINSVVGIPQSGSQVTRNADGTVSIKGYALPTGEGIPIIKVEISVDGGSTWQEAELLQDERESKWSWRLWKADIKIKAGKGAVIYSKATDAAGNTQPASSQWNLRGVCYHGYGDATDLEIV